MRVGYLVPCTEVQRVHMERGEGGELFRSDAAV